MFKKTIWIIFYIIIPLIFIFNIRPIHSNHFFLSLNWYKSTTNLNNSQWFNSSKKFKRNFYTFKNKLFYYNQKGEITHFINLTKNIFISPSRKNYILYHKTGTNFSLYKNNGELLWKMDNFSTPIIAPSGNFLFLLSTDQSNVSLYDEQKNKILPTRFLGSLLLDYFFTSDNDFVILGTSKGDLISLNNKKNYQHLYSFRNSQYNYIKGVSASKNSQYIVAIHGLGEEFISLLSQEGELIWQKPTHLKRLKRTSVFIDDINQLVVEPNRKNIAFRNLNNGKIKKILNISHLNKKNEDINYIKGDFKEKISIISVYFQTQSVSILIDNEFNILWSKNHQETYPLYVEITNNDILIQTSSYIKSIKINNHQSL